MIFFSKKMKIYVKIMPSKKNSNIYLNFYRMMKIVKEFKEFEKQAQSISIYQKKIHQIEEEVSFDL